MKVKGEGEQRWFLVVVRSRSYRADGFSFSRSQESNSGELVHIPLYDDLL